MAWAADFAQRTNNTDILAELPDALGKLFTSGEQKPSNDLSPRSLAAAALFDAIIQRHVPVQISLIRKIEDTHPIPAMILVSRVPLEEARPTLEEWVPRSSPKDAVMARIAVMLLAPHPKPSTFWGPNGN